MSAASVITAVCQTPLPAWAVVYNGIIPDVPDQRGHAILWCNTGQLERLSVAAQTDSSTVSWQVSTFGPTEQAASWLMDKITNHLMDTRITIPGWTPGVVIHTGSQGTRPDEAVIERSLVQATSQFRTVITKL